MTVDLGWFDIRNQYGGAGAVGDGVTDDGPAINRAIAAASYTGTPSRAGTVFIPPTTSSWNVITPLTVSLPISGNIPTGLRIIGSGCDGPLKVNVGNQSDFLTWSQYGEFSRGIIEHIAFMLGDTTGVAYSCRDLINASCAGPGSLVIRDCWDIGTHAFRSKIHMLSGNLKLETWHDGGGAADNGVSVLPLVLVDGSNMVDIDTIMSYWQMGFRGITQPIGGYSSIVTVSPMATSAFNGNCEGTLVAIRNLSAFIRVNTPVQCIGDASHIARQIIVADSFMNTGGNDLMYFDNCRKLKLRNINIANSSVARINIGSGVLENLHIDELTHTQANALQLWVDNSLTGTCEIDRSSIDVVRTSGGSPNAGPLSVPVFTNPSGTRARCRNALVALNANLLVKPDGLGDYIKLADGDDGKLATGVSQDATNAANVIFSSTEIRGQPVAFATDGTSIPEGSPVYHSQLAGHGGQVSAVPSGRQVGIATAGDAGGIVPGIFL